MSEAARSLAADEPTTAMQAAGADPLAVIEPYDPYEDLPLEDNFMVEAAFDLDGTLWRRVEHRLDASIVSKMSTQELAQVKPGPSMGEGVPPPVLSEVLQARLARLGEEEEIDVVVAVRGGAKIPRLRRMMLGEDRDSAENRLRLAQRERQLATVADARTRERAPVRAAIAALRGKVLDEMTLGHALVARLTKAGAIALAQDARVQSITPAMTDTPPPTVRAGRALIGTDHYFDQGCDGARPHGPYVGLIDTGVRSSHHQFSRYTGGGSLGFLRDCVHTNSVDCKYDGSNFQWSPKDFAPHGTSSASVIMADLTDWGNDYRGVTSAELDSWRVYSGGFTKENNVGAQVLVPANVPRAFGAAVRAGDEIILAEMQANEPWNGPIAKAAEDAFDAGSAVIATNGNALTDFDGDGVVEDFEGCPLTSCSPANAHKVLGVGAYEPTTGATRDQVSGLTSDGRQKPEFQAPTNTVTASGSGDMALGSFAGTSGAAPYATGLAVVLKDFLGSIGLPDDPGHIYATMLAFGTRGAPWLPEAGVGHISMPSCAAWWVGQTWVSNGDNVRLTAAVGTSVTRRLRVAIWWPEGWGAGHQDIDLRLYRPGGTQVAVSDSVDSVFEVIRYDNGASGTPIASGDYTIELRGYRVPWASQRVYYAILAECR